MEKRTMNPATQTPRRVPRNRPPRSEAGTTFAELMLATLIIGTTVVGASSSLSQSASVYHYFTDGPHEALMIAQEIHEAALLLPWDADVGAPANFGDDVVTLWDLDDEVYSPPRSAKYEVVSSHLLWKQKVDIDFVDLDNPTTVVDPAVFGGETIPRLKVRVYNGGLLVETFYWWMSEPENVQ